jgi:lysophospholipase L1-like esterase
MLLLNLSMVTKLDIITSWLGLPIYAFQGVRIRNQAMRMAPPEQLPFVEVNRKAKGEPLRLLFIGDSSAAGVGVTDFKECVAGRTPHLVSEKTGRSVTCRTCGNNSATAGELRDLIVPNLERAEYDYIIVNIGTNDAKNFHTKKRFKKEFGGLLYALNARFPTAKVIWSGIIDVSKIPLLPSPLNKLMGIRADILRQQANELCYERGALFPQTKWRIITENFAEDGFHASSKGYEEWAEELSSYIADLQNR